MNMRNVLVYAVLAASAGIAQCQGPRLTPAGAVTVRAESANPRIPVWSGNALLSIEGPATGPNAFVAYSPAGDVLLNAAFSIDGADQTLVLNWDRGVDGSLALCGTSFDRDGRAAPFIGWISADGASQRMIRTEPFTPHLIAVAADGSFWAVGRNLNSHRGERGVDLDAGVLRHFDQSGRPLGAYLPRSGFKNSVELSNNHGRLRALKDGVAWLHYLGSGDGSYTEISSRGDITNYPIPRPLKDESDIVKITGMAATAAGDVFVSMHLVGNLPGGSLFWLDRSKRGWLPVTLPPGAAGAYLFGLKGNDLVLQLIGDSPSTFRFYSVMW